MNYMKYMIYMKRMKYMYMYIISDRESFRVSGLGPLGLVPSRDLLRCSCEP